MSQESERVALGERAIERKRDRSGIPEQWPPELVVARVETILIAAENPPRRAIGGIVNDLFAGTHTIGDAAIGGRVGIAINPPREAHQKFARNVSVTRNEQPRQGDERIASPAFVEPRDAGVEEGVVLGKKIQKLSMCPTNRIGEYRI